MLTDAEVDHIAKLARLDLPQAMRAHLKRDLSKVLDYIALLETVDTDGVQPLYQVTGLQNQTRPDTPGSIVSTDSKRMEFLVGQAPGAVDRFVKVKGIKNKE